MQLKRFLTAALGAAGLQVLFPASGSALDLEDQQASYMFRNFADTDRVHVVSHFGLYTAGLGRDTEFSLQWNHETVTVPGVQAAAGTQEAVDAITTASRPISGGGDAFRDFSKVRNEIQTGVDMDRVQLGYYLSKESDYFAQQVHGTYNRDFFDQNFNLALGSGYGWDAIDPLADDDTQTGQDRRTTWNWNVVATQILTPTTVVRVGGEVDLVNGLQHNPYRNVYAGGGPVPERHPDNRVRRDAFLRVSQYLKNRSSLKADYVLYSDSWGVVSHTLGAQLHQYVGDDLIFRYRYRFYTQGAADFYRAEYEDPSGIDGYRTADYRLEEFNSHLFGVQASLNLGAFSPNRLQLRRLDFRLKYERYFNSNNFSADIFESGLSYRF